MPALIRLLPPRRWSYALAFAVCAGLMAYALYLQHVLGLEPCPLCVFQRVVVIAMGIVFLVAALHNPGDAGAKMYAALQIVLGSAGVALALRHLWVQAQPAGSVPTCGMGLNYMLESFPLTDVVEKVLRGSGECAKVDLVLGLSIPMWTLILFIGLIALALALVWRKPTR
jgi:disulfide bond formation protein DsbB